MNVRSSDRSVNSRLGGILHLLPASIDIQFAGTGQAGYGHGANLLGYSLYRFEVAVGRDREPGFDDVHAQSLELARQQEFFLYVHAGAGRLLAISQGSVEDVNAVV